MGALHDETAVELSLRLRSGEVTPLRLAEHYLSRIDALRGLGAFAEVTADAARSRAGMLRRTEESGALWGLPLAEKDLVARAGVPTRYGSAARRDFVPAASDPLAAALDRAGSVSLGKTATSEFGLTGYTEPRIAPPARNPWDPGTGAGGSSGGAAVAVAAGLLPVAVGSDGGGSIRIPAATVGIVGLKPSRGRLPLGSGMDSPDGLAVAGPLARTVEDAAFLLDAMCGLAPYGFATTAGDRPPFRTTVLADLPVLRVGATTVSPWDDDMEIRLDAEALQAFNAAAGMLSGLGHVVDEADWRPRGYPELFRVLWRASAARLPLTEQELAQVEPITAWLVREGRALNAVTLLEALAGARAFERATIEAFAPFDVVLTPALAQAPQPIGWYDAQDAERSFAQQVQYSPYTSFVNVAGLPALVIPVTLGRDGRPVSVQLIGRPGGERAILAAAGQLESLRGPLPHPPVW